MRIVYRILLLTLTFATILYIFLRQPVGNSLTSSIKKSAIQLVQPKAKGCFAVLIRNRELEDFRITMRELEDRFNRNYNYPYVFMNDVQFTEEFKVKVRQLTKAEIHFALIPKKYWSIPPHIDNNRTMETLKEMEASKRVPYGGSLSYRHMIRFESGFFSQLEEMQQFDYYWRVEPKVKFTCDIDFDPFLYMKQNNKKYAFTIAMNEFMATIPTLYSTVRSWMEFENIKLAHNSSIDFVSNDKGKTYNGCHFWSNFEIGSLDMFRSKQYRSFFKYLDAKGGFFYERWGDAPVHSLYAAMFLNRDELHFFNEIGYVHDLYQHCPVDPVLNSKCICNPRDSSDLKSGCLNRWLKLNGRNPYKLE